MSRSITAKRLASICSYYANTSQSSLHQIITSSSISIHQHYTTKHFFSSTSHRQQDDQPSRSSSWMPNWMKSKLPAALGGDREEISKMENMTLDDFAASARNARRIGSLTGFASGTSSASDATAQGTLRLFENIVGAMTDEEKHDLSAFGPTQRQRVAQTVNCTTMQVDDCIARYLWTKQMSKVVAERKKKGLPMPSSLDELERMVGTWRQYKQENTTTAASHNGGGNSSGSGLLEIPLDAVDKNGGVCGLAGVAVSKNSKCRKTNKAYKACCGRRR